MADYKEPKVFIGKVAFYHHEQYGDKIKLSLNRDDIKLLIDRIGNGDKVTVLMHTNKSGKWYGEIDTWKPQPKQNGLPEFDHARSEARDRQYDKQYDKELEKMGYTLPTQTPQRYGEDDLPPVMDKDGIPF